MTLTNEFNQKVRRWASGTKKELKLKVVQETTKYSGHSRQDLDTKVRNYAGEASKINFNFPYYMVFVHKGAGRGYGGNKTGLFTRRDGSKRATREASMGRMGTGKRVAKPWFNPVIESRFGELEQIIGEYHGNKVALAMERILVR